MAAKTTIDTNIPGTNVTTQNKDYKMKIQTNKKRLQENVRKGR